KKRRDRAGVSASHLVDDGPDVDRPLHNSRSAHEQLMLAQPPATGGITATSSPAAIATSSVAYSSFTAMMGRGGSLGDSAAIAARTPPTVAGSGTVTVVRSPPRASA